MYKSEKQKWNELLEENNLLRKTLKKVMSIEIGVKYNTSAEAKIFLDANEVLKNLEK